MTLIYKIFYNCIDFSVFNKSNIILVVVENNYLNNKFDIEFILIWKCYYNCTIKVFVKISGYQNLLNISYYFLLLKDISDMKIKGKLKTLIDC